MSGVQTVREFFDAFEFGKWDKLEGCMAEDFTFNAGMPRPLNGDQYLKLAQALYTAFPDWQFNARYFQEEGDEVRVTTQITATHTDDLDLSALGLPYLPATNRPISMPGEHNTLIVRDGQIHSVDVFPTTGGGVPGLLAQLGVTLPSVR